MKSPTGDRPKNDDVLARKRALIRSLIERTNFEQPQATPSPAPGGDTPKLAPIIPFPLDGKLEMER